MVIEYIREHQTGEDPFKFPPPSLKKIHVIFCKDFLVRPSHVFRNLSGMHKIISFFSKKQKNVQELIGNDSYDVINFIFNYLSQF